MVRLTHKYFIFLFLIAAATNALKAQDTLRPAEVNVKKTKFAKLGLYDGDYQEDFNVRGFAQLDIFSGSTSDFWKSEGSECINSSLTKDNTPSLLLEWNKDQDGCDWVGMGFGWDSWQSKDIGYVVDTLALTLTVRSTGEAFTNIPWAFCFEDYSGGQAWLGYNKKFLKSKVIDRNWTDVEIPLSLFPFEENEVNLTNIKQMMVQVFSEGSIEIKSIKLTPFNGALEKTYNAQASNETKVDGILNEWKNESFHSLDEHLFAVSFNEESVNLAFSIKDETPRENSHQNEKLWDGDAIEIAISTNLNADTKRKFLLLSDKHFGVNVSRETPYVWDFKTGERADCLFKIVDNEKGYDLEISIPTGLLNNIELTNGLELDFEIAIDEGTKSGRIKQERWNSGDQAGFHQSPSLWGKLKLD